MNRHTLSHSEYVTEGLIQITIILKQFLIGNKQLLHELSLYAYLSVNFCMTLLF